MDAAGSEGKLANMLDKGPDKEVPLEPAKVETNIPILSLLRQRLMLLMSYCHGIV